MRSSVNFHGHMYTAVFDSMESSLRDAVRRELMTQDELATQRKREAQTRSKVHLPVSEFYAETRFYRGKGGQTGTMRRQIDDRLDDEYACSCGAKCDGDVAVIRCLTCAKFDPGGRGHYCGACFRARHPGHRARHAWVEIRASEHLGRQLRYRNKLAEHQVFGDEIADVLTTMKKEASALRKMQADDATAKLVREVDAKVHDVNVRASRLRRALRAPALRPLSEISGGPLAEGNLVTKGLLALYKSKQKSSTSDPRYRKSTDDASLYAENRGGVDRDHAMGALALPPLTPPKTADSRSSTAQSKRRPRSFAQVAMWEVHPEHAAASLFARAYRKRCARRDLARAVQARFMKVYDANTGFYYFVDTRTRAVSWEPPKVLWNDERYRVTSKRDGVDAVVVKREAMARAAAKIMTPRSWADKHKPKGVNLEAMKEEESDADGDSSSSGGDDDDGSDAPDDDRPARDADGAWALVDPDAAAEDY